RAMSSAKNGGEAGAASGAAEPDGKGSTARFGDDWMSRVPSVRDIEIEVIEGPAAGRRFRSSGTSVTVGSAELCELVIPDPTVSRFHCEIRIDESGARLRDTGSLNGTVLDGVHIVEAYLRGGSTVRLGRSAIRFDYGSDRSLLQVSSAR